MQDENVMPVNLAWQRYKKKTEKLTDKPTFVTKFIAQKLQHTKLHELLSCN